MSDWERAVPCRISPREFFAAIKVWIDKPQVINKRLWGTHQVHSFQAEQIDFRIIHNRYLSNEDIEDEEKCVRFLTDNGLIKISNDDSKNILHVTVMKQLPRLATERSVYQLVGRDYVSAEVDFMEIGSGRIHSLCPRFPYSLRHNEDNITLRGKSVSTDCASVQWLQDIVLPQIAKWAEENNAHLSRRDVCTGSLNLVDNDAYYVKYNELKVKYGKEMVKIWPECTDPAKFVYEDVGIASYLLLLWALERKRQGVERLQSFVDLGCGNGLLVYILSSEGHRGLGVDVRRRQIWDMYPSHVILKEQTISPSDEHLFPEADWIIGNHSDELTPWIPVLAARSSYKCNFFLLPCCCYNFNGTKYQRKDSSKSQYSEYLEHIQRLCEKCGFKTSIDKLKIPSTKRTCLIGTDRTYASDKFSDIHKTIKNIVAEDDTAGENWIKDFKPRETTERVRNCTQINKTVINSIVKIVTDHLIKDCKEGEEWSIGQSVELSEVVKLIPENLLKCLKAECGGLQTLLRNNHQIFRVEFGKVQLRYPQTVSEVTAFRKNRKKSKLNNISLKKKICWFHSNHPQSCPLSDVDCSFIHAIE